ncbi:MAG: class I SAM-dependent methyltransferase [Bacteroidetes bacterium]|nr:class I SAM-dependent methyltransferase [Bacteroidota bacterium]
MIQIDIDKGIVIKDNREYPIGSPYAFKIISEAWLRSGWDSKYVYSFTWLGRPVIQLPEDLMRIQEVIFNIKPDVIIETGVAHGGSLIFYASLCKAMGKGKVIGVDIEIRSPNRNALETHFLFPFITLIEGNSTNPEIISIVKQQVKSRDKVLILLDSKHSYSHVLAELKAYSELVSLNSYIVATDGIMEYVVGAPRTNPDWVTNNPKKAAEQFVRENPNFIIEEPAFPFNEGMITERVTYWPGAYIKRVK